MHYTLPRHSSSRIGYTTLMWNTVMAINTFIVLPIVSIFLVYAFGRAVILWEWKLFVIALVVFSIAVIAELILGMIDG